MPQESVLMLPTFLPGNKTPGSCAFQGPAPHLSGTWKHNSKYAPQGGSKYWLWGPVEASKSAGGMKGAQGNVNFNCIFPLRWHLTVPQVKVKLQKHPGNVVDAGGLSSPIWCWHSSSDSLSIKTSNTVLFTPALFMSFLMLLPLILLFSPISAPVKCFSTLKSCLQIQSSLWYFSRGLPRTPTSTDDCCCCSGSHNLALGLLSLGLNCWDAAGRWVLIFASRLWSCLLSS